jgi:hypothetical protein
MLHHLKPNAWRSRLDVHIRAVLPQTCVKDRSQLGAERLCPEAPGHFFNKRSRSRVRDGSDL